MRGNNDECGNCCISCLGQARRVSEGNGLENTALHMLLNMIHVVPNPSLVWHSLLNNSKEEEEDPVHKPTSL